MKPVILGFAILATAASAFAQIPVQNRIPQQIVINGQAAAGAYVLTPTGSIQNYTCTAPQVYTTPDGATHGWACQESTGTWLLGALPPQQAVPVVQPVVVQPAPLPQVIAQPPQVVYVAPQQPTVIYTQPAPVIYSAPVVYSSPVIYPAPVIYSVPAARPVIVRSYPSSTAVEVAAIHAGGRIAVAAIDRHRTVEVIERGGGRRR